MGRTERSQGLAPPPIRKDMRAKQARHIVNKVVPAILASNSRARKGVDGSELIVDPGPETAFVEANVKADVKEDGERANYIKRKGQGRRKAKGRIDDDDVVVRAGHEKDERETSKSKKKKDSLDDAVSKLSLAPSSPPDKQKTNRIVRIITSDTLTAAKTLTASKPSRKEPNACILNMASPLRPGGGVLSGATSQEEFLCARTTLLPSLKEEYYRLPEFGGIYTHEVLVFHSSLSLGDPKGELGPGERWWVDVISAGMLRFPELEGEEGEGKRLGKKDKIVVEKKMRAVLRIACSRGVKKLVLGAWGCGAYGNPVRDIAEAWATILRGNNGSSQNRANKADNMESWTGIEEVVFAISNTKMANDFARAFGGSIEVEAGFAGERVEEDDDDVEDAVAKELKVKIDEMESQLGKVWNPDLKQRMGVILEGLRAQLREREGNGEDGGTGTDGEDENDEESSENTDREETCGGESEEEHDEEGAYESDGQAGGLELPLSR